MYCVRNNPARKMKARTRSFFLASVKCSFCLRCCLRMGHHLFFVTVVDGPDGSVIAVEEGCYVVQAQAEVFLEIGDEGFKDGEGAVCELVKGNFHVGMLYW